MTGSDKDRSKEIPFGICVLSVLFILTSLMHMYQYFVNPEWYWQMFQDLPSWLIIIRYIFSWTLRILYLVLVVGLLHLKEICRKITIGLGLFSICTVPLKHPYLAFMRHTTLLDQQFGSYLAMFNLSEHSFSEIMLTSMLIAWFIDITFAIWYIYYLRKPSVKACFS